MAQYPVPGAASPTNKDRRIASLTVAMYVGVAPFLLGWLMELLLLLLPPAAQGTLAFLAFEFGVGLVDSDMVGVLLFFLALPAALYCRALVRKGVADTRAARVGRWMVLICVVCTLVFIVGMGIVLYLLPGRRAW